MQCPTDDNSKTNFANMEQLKQHGKANKPPSAAGKGKGKGKGRGVGDGKVGQHGAANMGGGSGSGGGSSSGGGGGSGSGSGGGGGDGSNPQGRRYWSRAGTGVSKETPKRPHSTHGRESSAGFRQTMQDNYHTHGCVICKVRDTGREGDELFGPEWKGHYPLTYELFHGDTAHHPRLQKGRAQKKLTLGDNS